MRSTANQEERSLAIKLLRGLGFMLLAVPGLLFLSWLLGGWGLVIGGGLLIGNFVEGFSGGSLLGSKEAKSAKDSNAPGRHDLPPSASTEANSPPSPTLPSNRQPSQLPVQPRRRHGLWWKIPAWTLVGTMALLIAIAQLLPVDEAELIRKRNAREELAQSSPVTPPALPAAKNETLEDYIGADKIERAGDWVIVRMRPGTVWSAKWYVIHAGDMLYRIGKWAKDDVDGRIGAKKIILQVWPEATDKYGKTTRVMVLALEIDPREFTKINWDGLFSGDHMLNLVEIQQLWPAIAPAVTAYCQDSNRVYFARQFCENASRFIH